MILVIRLSLMTVLILAAILAGQAPQTGPFELSKHIKLPDDFVIERIAGPPLVRHPMHVSVDEQNHLYVTEAAGVNRNGQQLEKELPNCIKKLSDTNHDGIYDHATVFADKLTFPGGVLAYQGAVYTTSFPYLWKFIDKDKDGVADERIPLIGKFGSVGNGADLHGPQLGPDGWLYFCDGRNGHDLKFADGTSAKGKASGVYRCKPDGTGFERILGAGMDNPVEVAFTPAGEPLICANLVLSNPRHDGILLALEGGVYPYDLRAVRELKWTGAYLPIMGDLGWVAVSSLMRYDHGAWGKEFHNKYFTAEFNNHSLRLHNIQRDGGGFKMTSSQFLNCNHPDFHPTQITSAPDGSLLLVDTGGWFRNGCPESQIAKPEIAGGIYRIYKKDVQKPGLIKQPKEITRLSAQQPKTGNEDLESTLSASDIDVRIRALRQVSLGRDASVLDLVLKQLEHPHPAVRRDAATALGRIKKSESILGLIAALEQADDPYLEHALIYALICIGDPGATRLGLSHASPRTSRGVLIALDQMGESALSWDQVAPLLQREDTRLKEAVLDVVGRRSGWIVELADYLERELRKKEWDERRLAGIRHLLLALIKEPRVQQLMADRLACPEEVEPIRLLLLEAMAQADLPIWPAVWTGPLKAVLGDTKVDDEMSLQAVLAASASRRRDFDAILRVLAESTERPPLIRLNAAGVALQDREVVSDRLLDFLMGFCKTVQEPTHRLASARALSVAFLSEAQLIKLAGLLIHTGPLELPVLLGAWEHSASETALRALLDALNQIPASATIPADRLEKLLSHATTELKTQAGPLVKKLKGDLTSQHVRITQLQPALNGGDAKLGRELFFGNKAVCSTCHRVGNQGGVIGPNLTQIGAIRSRADLLEAVVFPSASLTRGYETLTVVSKDGKTLTGVLTRETTDALVLTNAQRQEQKILRQEIEDMKPSPISTMPAGMDQTLTLDEIRHLLAYLATLKK